MPHTLPRVSTWRRPVGTLLLFLTLLGLAETLRAQERPADERPAARQDAGKKFGMSLREMMDAGGTIGWVIVGLSIAMVALMIQQALTLRQGAMIPAGLPEQAHALIQQGQYRQAEQVSQQSQSFLGRLLAHALAEASLGYAAMNQAMEDSAVEQSARLLRRVEYFSLIGTLAPMLGLLGTVWGMILAFMEFEQKANPQVSELAPGIYKALVTTLQGLIVAIPSLALYAYFRNRVDEMVARSALMAEHIFADYRRTAALARRQRKARKAATTKPRPPDKERPK